MTLGSLVRAGRDPSRRPRRRGLRRARPRESGWPARLHHPSWQLATSGWLQETFGVAIAERVMRRSQGQTAETTARAATEEQRTRVGGSCDGGAAWEKS
jgi:hypothetical protein